MEFMLENWAAFTAIVVALFGVLKWVAVRTENKFDDKLVDLIDGHPDIVAKLGAAAKAKLEARQDIDQGGPSVDSTTSGS